MAVAGEVIPSEFNQAALMVGWEVKRGNTDDANTLTKTKRACNLTNLTKLALPASLRRMERSPVNSAAAAAVVLC